MPAKTHKKTPKSSSISIPGIGTAGSPPSMQQCHTRLVRDYEKLTGAMTPVQLKRGVNNVLKWAQNIVERCDKAIAKTTSKAAPRAAVAGAGTTND